MVDYLNQGEHNFESSNLLVIHVIEEQSIVESCDNFLLSQNDCAVVPCDREELCDDIPVVSMPQLVNKLNIDAAEPIDYAENNIFIPITCVQDELKLLTSLILRVI